MCEKPRILQVLRPTAGGIGKHIVTLAEGMREHFDVTVACPAKGPEKELRAAGIMTLPLPLAGEMASFSDLKTLRILVRYMMEQGVSIVHSHGAKAALLARPAALVAGVPVSIYTSHNSLLCDSRPAWKKITAIAVERLLAGPTDCIIAVSRALGEEMADRGRIKRDKIRIIHNGINTVLAKRGNGQYYKEKWHIPADRVVVGTVARMAPQKGLEVLVGAAEHLVHRDGYNAHFLVAGDGPLRKKLLTLVETAGLGNHFTFPGMVSDTAGVYDALDVFTLPSLTEGLPLALLEAMARPLPVVASDVGGVPEVVNHSHTGLLVTPGRPGELSAAIAWLLDNPGKARKMADKARAKVLHDFGAVQMIERTMQLYLELLMKKGLSAPGDEIVVVPK